MPRLLERLKQSGVDLSRPDGNKYKYHFVLKDSSEFLEICKFTRSKAVYAAARVACATKLAKRTKRPQSAQWAQTLAEKWSKREKRWKEAYRLVSLVACDERSLEDNTFKVYCILSVPGNDEEVANLPEFCRSEGDLITIEVPVGGAPDEPTFKSIREYFRAAVPLEREIEVLFGIGIEHASFLKEKDQEQDVLRRACPRGYYPLRRGAEDTPAVLSQRGKPVSQDSETLNPQDINEGVMILPVGPIHAGVIQAGYFPFRVAGEVVETLPITLGYTHRGVEKLFERKLLADGWRLSERVAGDSAFAHSLAYCHAVESLASFEVSECAWLWRGLLLELERLCNHLADCGAIVHDMAFDAISSPLTAKQEEVVRLGEKLTGNRLLRGVNRPGGVVFDAPGKGPEMLKNLPSEIARFVDEYLNVIIPALELPQCRDRLISTGILTDAEALALGATGLPARASGLTWRDFRLRHPQGIYRLPDVQDIIHQTFADDRPANDDNRPQQARHGGTACENVQNTKEKPARKILVRRGDLTGDVLARTWLRLAECETSVQIIEKAAEKLGGIDPMPPSPVAIEAELRNTYNFDFGLGYAEGWRGEICYWIMKGPDESIYRCKVRDPSVFNWPALATAMARKENRDAPPGVEPHENILADFPLVNKSFNLSYAGNDL